MKHFGLVTGLFHLQGSFAFILHDSRTRYTLVARKGSSLPLYWGADNADGDSLIISTVPAYLSPFPPGCAFEVHSPGWLATGLCSA